MKIRKDSINKNTYINSYTVILKFILLFFTIDCGFSQIVQNDHRIYFISDTQEPLLVEKMVSKYYRNEEARDSLFSDIIRHHPENIFMLGDLTSMGSDEEAWAPFDTFIHLLSKINTNIYAIPGNHEYFMNSSIGMKMFTQRFPKLWLHGYCIKTDSIAIIMLNSNFDKISESELSKQLLWYKTSIDSLDNDPKVKTIIVCTHHAPYSNSKAVGSSEGVADLIVPLFKNSRKARLFISGHSHNLEYFADSFGKHFLVIGGGGGIAQPLIDIKERKYHDLLSQNEKPLYFYLIVERKGNFLKLIARGFKRDFKMFEMNFGEIKLN